MHDYSAQSVIPIVLYFDFATIGCSASGMNVCCGLCLKPVLHFLCFLPTRVELMTSTQTNFRYVTIRLKWKTGLISSKLYTVKNLIINKLSVNKLININKLIIRKSKKMCLKFLLKNIHSLTAPDFNWQVVP